MRLGTVLLTSCQIIQFSKPQNCHKTTTVSGAQQDGLFSLLSGSLFALISWEVGGGHHFYTHENMSVYNDHW